MKFLTIILIYFLTIKIIKSSRKTFLDIAKEEVFKDTYNSDSYKNEAASLNPEYYTPKGKQELTKCRDLYSANFDRCRRFSTCTFCAANSDCGWCDEKKICIPIDLNIRKDQQIPICQGDCIRVLKIEYCYKGLFEPENTQDEVNFANYNEVLDNSEDNDENIFEKSLEKIFLEGRNKKTNSIFKFKQETEKGEASCEGQNDGLPNDFTKNLNVVPDHRSLDYIPNASTNRRPSVNMKEHQKYLVDSLTKISKDTFFDLLNNNINTNNDNKYNQMPQIDYKTDDQKREEMFQYLKEYIPNFEFPQFVKSDLEDSIDKIKKEKLLLWLRGYSLNEDISKQHLPIYKNLTIANEDDARKVLLDKFYKDIVRDKYSKVNSVVYKNLIGEKTLSGDEINKNKYNHKPVHENSKTSKILNNIDSIQPVGAVDKNKDNTKENTSYRSLNNITNKVVNTKFISREDLSAVVKRNNMRFKEKTKNNINSMATVKEISNQLKDYLKTLK